MAIRTSSKKITSFIFCTLLLMVPLFVSAQNRSVTISNNETCIKVMDGKHSFTLIHTGAVEISDDNTEIVSIANGGYFEFSKKHNGKKKKVKINSNRDGTLKHQFFIGFKEYPYEPEGRNWMEEMLPEIVERTNLGSDAKMRKLYESGGVSAVHDELATKKDDHLKVDYFEFLLEQDLTEADIEETLQLATKTIDGEHYLVDLMEDNTRKILKSKNGKNIYMNAMQSLKSGHYKSELISEYIDEVDFDEENATSLMEFIATFKSDHYFAEAVEDIAEQKGLSDNVLAILITESMKPLDSGHYKSEILDEILDNHDLGPKSLYALYEVIPSIDKGHYFHEVVDNVADTQRLNEQELADLILVLEHLTSDHYISESLQELSDKVSHHGGTALEAYMKVAGNINSKHYYHEVMDALH